MRSEYHPAMTRAGNVLASVVGALGLVALLTAGCSSDEAATATTAIAPTTIVETTPLPPATDPTTTEPTTTTAPTTTLDPAATLAAEVEADFLEADRLGREASMDPFDEAKEAAALDRRLGVIRDNFAATLADYRTRNYAIRENPTTAALITVEVPAALVVEGGDLAEMQICEVDSWILVEVGAGPNGEDAIVSGETSSYRSLLFLRDVDGKWRIEGGSEIGRWEGLAECPGE
jgi:hypothetical protein